MTSHVRVQQNGNTASFSSYVCAGDFVFVSGQASVEDGVIVPGTFEEELRRSIENVRKVLGETGLRLSDVVKVGAYVDDPADVPEFNRLYREYFREPLPARTTLTGCLGGIIKFEIDVVAYAGE
ncbi:RidA family protein [Amycolatopsis acidiphila]|uniref:RidA family protein n=1 Tax=Amycolatopsis acidiphila TaxID=715473 RepID=A0A558AN53_9PSEU|nr:RidA family protein [Amycolatopsis acidiphila]TVT25670.1 RidA family protein [Amycolatopsis acidiphila]UIJ60426.1 RidA family protein [Amycolatopsis acidiphila]GHG90229.1 translation initiation inhibitor [Amycolatopsis acidiphila]